MPANFTAGAGGGRYCNHWQRRLGHLVLADEIEDRTPVAGDQRSCLCGIQTGPTAQRHQHVHLVTNAAVPELVHDPRGRILKDLRVGAHALTAVRNRGSDAIQESRSLHASIRDYECMAGSQAREFSCDYVLPGDPLERPCR